MIRAMFSSVVHFRAEMHLPIVSVRYGLMLEAYCRGCGKYRDSLANQVIIIHATHFAFILS